MRLIDADALIRSLSDWQFSEAPVYERMTGEEWNNARLIYETIDKVIKGIESQPTIKPERKKGKWINKTIQKRMEYDYSCSECGRHVSVMRGYDVRIVYPFCHCGADMRKAGDAK